MDLKNSDAYKLNDEDTKKAANIQMAILGVVGAITAIMIILVICSCKKIKLVIAILKSAALFMADTPQILIVPPLFGLVTIIFWLAWMLCLIFVYTTGEIKGSGENPFATVTLND